jgi:hypothetical protein
MTPDGGTAGVALGWTLGLVGGVTSSNSVQIQAV